MVSRVTLEHLDRLEQQVQLDPRVVREMLEQWVQLEMLVLLAVLVMLVPLVRLVVLVQVVPLDRWDSKVRREALDTLVPPATKDKLEIQEQWVLPDTLELLDPVDRLDHRDSSVPLELLELVDSRVQLDRLVTLDTLEILDHLASLVLRVQPDLEVIRVLWVNLV